MRNCELSMVLTSVRMLSDQETAYADGKRAGPANVHKAAEYYTNA